MADEKTVENEAIQKVVKATKRGFDPKARLQGRGLRKGTIQLYLDDEVGAQLGEVREVMVQVPGHVMPQKRKERSGILGDLDEVQDSRESAIAVYEQALKNSPDMPQADKTKAKKALDSILEGFDTRIAELETQRDELIEELKKTSFIIKLQAVPPIIQKDALRRAKITQKNLLKLVSEDDDQPTPEEKAADLKRYELLHLMSDVLVSIHDVESDSTNDEVTFQDCMDLQDHLPPSQWRRLDIKLYEIQLADAISQQIESQEDFS